MCDQCRRLYSEHSTVCGDCEKSLCSRCAAENKCDVWRDGSDGANPLAPILYGNGYSLCEACFLTANRVQENLSDHLRTCDIGILSIYAFAAADEEIQNIELQIDHLLMSRRLRHAMYQRSWEQMTWLGNIHEFVMVNWKVPNVTVSCICNKCNIQRTCITTIYLYGELLPL